MSTPPPVTPDSPPPQSPPPAPPPWQVSDVIPPPPSPIHPVVVLIVGILFWGIAYFLYGQWKKGLASLLLYVGVVIVAVMTCGVGKLLFGPIWVLTFLDAYLQAKNLQEGRSIREWTFFNQTA